MLSRREIEVAQLIGEGMSNKEIAFQLKLSEFTVKEYLVRIYKKLGFGARGSPRVNLALWVRMYKF